jgi:hypothetical protein
VSSPQPGDVSAGTLSPVRTRYVAVARVAVDLLAGEQLRKAWDGASVLEEFSVGDLAGHLAMSVLLPVDLLDGPDPASASPITAEQYYAAIEGLDDIDSEVNVGVRRRSAQVAAGGPDALAEQARAALERLTEHLAEVPAGRQVETRGRALTVDEYLRTRLVELAVHLEDLELSVGLGPGLAPGDDVADVPDDVLDDVLRLLVGVARIRHGDAAVVRALTRRERDVANVLRVF